MARPTVVTPEVLQKLEYAFSIGCTDVEACFHADIAPSTLYNYQNDNPDFLERKEALKEALVLKARTVVKTALENDDKQTAQWYLERKKKAEFSLKTESDVNVSGSLDLRKALDEIDGTSAGLPSDDNRSEA